MSNKVVPEIYREVIKDVITNIRHEFEEYGVAEDVLEDLRSRWESKMISSNVADFEPEAKNAPEQPQVPPPVPPMPASFPPPPPPPHPTQYPPHPGYPPHPQYPPNGPLPPINIKSEPGLNEPRYPLTVGQAMHMQNYLPHPSHPPPPPHSGQPPANGSAPQYHQPPPRAGGRPPWAGQQGNTRQQHDVPQIPQLDGPSSTSSASSATPPPGAGIANTSGGGQRAGGEEEINSDLDDSDSEGEGAEDVDSGAPGQDIVFCTYDKVARVKNKWKCVLKDGMVHVNGKDYVFQKCTGEFEW
ncbi:hypothetical protein M422DRAFT_23756 [Sphaerobolus stellatus SS14]|nr:hypothetical protein M422DRAFT_23756 [Sphaerobolus stellatus SS14]